MKHSTISLLFCLPLLALLLLSPSQSHAREAAANSGPGSHGEITPATLFAGPGDPSIPAETAGKRLARLADSIFFWTPDTGSDPHTKGFRIPVYIIMNSGVTGCDPNSMTVVLTFNATMFFPRSVTRGTIVRNDVAGDNRTVEISMSGTAPMQQGILTELVGDVMLGNSESTKLDLTIQCGGVATADSIYDGELRMRGSYCEQGSDRVLIYLDGFGITKIVPNPSSGSVVLTVKTVELEPTHLEIYSGTGQRVYHETWRPANLSANEMTRRITLPDGIPNGIYQAVISSPGRRQARTLIIAK